MHDHHASDAHPRGPTATDPVCGMRVEIATAQHTAEHAGQTYYFCSKGCRLDFADEPGKFLDPSYEPSMEGHH